jgi:hypothetical protein
MVWQQNKPSNKWPDNKIRKRFDRPIPLGNWNVSFPIFGFPRGYFALTYLWTWDLKDIETFPWAGGRKD